MKIKATIKTCQKMQAIKKEGDIYKISLKNEAIKNKANFELIKLLEKHLGKKVTKIIGAKTHEKLIELE
ncbi:MAG: hypothetical protein WC393_03690 [Candidatus Nanoarchaeia archaeon]|jgi:uncharacterized protein YggU (UPF0235/DUF167 family)